MADDWGNDPIQSMGMDHTQASALFDKTFGKGKWRLTGGYRTPGREAELRGEGAMTVAPGGVSGHSKGLPDAPGAYDIVVDGLTPEQASAKLKSSGTKFTKLLPETTHGTQGAHLHVQPEMTFQDDWGDDPVQKVEAAKPKLEKDWSKAPWKEVLPEAAKKVIPSAIHDTIEGVKSSVTGAAHAAKEDFGKPQAAQPSPYIQAHPEFQGHPLAGMANALKDYVTGAYGSVPNLKRTLATDPGRPVLDAATVASLAAGPEGFAGRTAETGAGVAARAAEIAPKNGLRGVARPPEPTPARVPHAQAKAEDMLAKRLAKDQGGRAPTAQEMLEHAARTPDKPMTLMDVGGPRTKGLAGSVVRSPTGEGGSQIERFLGERSEMQGPRLEGDVQRQIGAGSSRQTIRSLRDAQQTAAKPLYEDAFEANPVMESSVIDQIVRSKQGAAAWAEARDRAKGWVVGTDKPIPDKYSLRTMDQLKQVFDDKISVARRAGENGTAALYQGMKDKLVTELDTLDKRSSNGLYAKARKTFSDGAQSQNAVEFGRTALNMNAEDIADKFRSLNDGDKEMARLGVAEALRDQISKTNVGRNAATNLSRNRALQNKLAPFFDSPAKMQKFLDAVTAEDTMFRTDNEVLRGSQTAARRAEDEGEDAKLLGHAVDAGKHLVRGKPLSALASGGRAAWEMMTRPDPEVSNHLARLLTEPLAEDGPAKRLLDPDARQVARNRLSALRRQQATRAIGRAAPQVGAGNGLLNVQRGVVPTATGGTQQAQ